MQRRCPRGRDAAGCSEPRGPLLRQAGAMPEGISWAEPKLMGALQVLIGVACLGFGGVASIISQPSLVYWTLAVATGYPFWSGVTFVASGCLSVAVEYVDKPILVKSSLGTNIISAMFAGIGTILLVVELVGNRVYEFASSRLSRAGNGIAGVMLFLSVLELSIAILLSYRGRQATRHLRQPVLPFAPHAARSHPARLPVTPSAPPAYCNNGYAP